MYILRVLFALAVAFPCGNVEASVVKEIPINGPLQNNEEKIFRINCDSACRIFSIKTTDRACVQLNVNSGGSNFGSGQCPGPAEMTNLFLNKNTFVITVKQTSNKHPIQNTKIKVTAKNDQISFTKLNAEGAKILQKDGGGQFVEIESGYLVAEFPYYKQVKVTCDGNCRGVKISKRNGRGNARLTASEAEPALIHKNGCYNRCFCESQGTGTTDICKDGEKDQFDLNSNVAYVALIPHPNFNDVKATFEAQNIKSVQILDISLDIQALSDGSLVVPFNAPIGKNENVQFGFECKSTKCTRTTIEVLSTNGHFKIKTGGKDKPFTCSGSSRCARTLQHDTKYFDVNLKALDAYDGYGYLKVKDNNLKGVLG